MTLDLTCDARELDPFGYFPGIISRVAGIWDGGVTEDPSYVFHTPYIGLSPGSHCYRVTFEGLRAREGTIVISVNELAYEPHQIVNTLKTVAMPLRDLVHRGGRLALGIQARANRTYAIFGSIHGPTDAAALALTVSLAAGDMVPFAATASPGGQATTRPVPRLTSRDEPTLSNPVSQVCTPAQFDEPSYDFWLSFLHLPNRRLRSQWETIYILQALKRYGAIQPNARALGLGSAAAQVPAALAALGCEVTVVDLPGPAGVTDEERRDALRRPDLCSDQRFDEAVTLRIADVSPLPPALNAFDLAWCADLTALVETATAAFELAEAALLALRPGGMAVFTIAFQFGERADSLPDDGALRRTDIDRFALWMLALGHDVAQLRYSRPHSGPTGGERITAFGLIVRRGGIG